MEELEKKMNGNLRDIKDMKSNWKENQMNGQGDISKRKEKESKIKKIEGA